MKINEIIEAFPVGNFDDSKVSYQWVNDSYFKNATKVKDINDKLSLYENNNVYLLIKNEETILGLIKLSSVTIRDNMYNNVDMIYVFPEYRNTSAIKWLIFSVKEESQYPIIADGAIFKDGNNLIRSLTNHGILKVSILDKNTGDKTSYDNEINDLDKCYLFEKVGCGYSSKFLDESGPTIWYNFFD